MRRFLTVLVPATLLALAVVTPAGASSPTTTTVATPPPASAFCQAAVAAGEPPTPNFPDTREVQVVAVGRLMQEIPSAAGIAAVRPGWDQLDTLMGDYLSTVARVLTLAPTPAARATLTPKVHALELYVSRMRRIYALGLAGGLAQPAVRTLGLAMARAAIPSSSAILYFHPAITPSSILGSLCPSAFAAQELVRVAYEDAQSLTTTGTYTPAALALGVTEANELDAYPSDQAGGVVTLLVVPGSTPVGEAVYAASLGAGGAPSGECVDVPTDALLNPLPRIC